MCLKQLHGRRGGAFGAANGAAAAAADAAGAQTPMAGL
jgi:hypothetical protein